MFKEGIKSEYKGKRWRKFVCCTMCGKRRKKPYGMPSEEWREFVPFWEKIHVAECHKKIEGILVAYETHELSGL